MPDRHVLKNIMKEYPLFLITIPLTFFIHAANYYFKLLSWNYIIKDCIIYTSAPFIIYFILGRIFRSYKKSAALLAAFLVVFYFFYLLYDGLKNNPVLHQFAQYWILLPLVFILLFIYSFYILKRKRNFQPLFKTFNITFLLLCIGGSLQYVFLLFSNTQAQYDHADIQKNLTAQYKPCDTCQQPDIYFLLFDGYTNDKILSEEFSYPNNELKNLLLRDSFFIPKESKSNYNFTHMSMGSAFNMQYLKNLSVNNKFFTKDFFEANYTIYKNELCAILSKQGYTIENYSIFDIKNAPQQITPALTELTWRSVMGQTFFNKVLRDIGWHIAKFLPDNYIPAIHIKKEKDDLKRLQETIEGINRIASTTSGKPRFLYAHFLMPHETYYFDSTGKRLDRNYTFKTVVNKKDYLQQLVYTNKFIIKPVIDSITANARRPFAIILQSDHGFRNYELKKTQLEFENMTAFYFSDKDYVMLTDSLSQVNTFRIVLNKYFKQNLPLLPDSTINLYK